MSIDYRPASLWGRRSKRRLMRSTMVSVMAISAARLARVPSASTMIPALLSMRFISEQLRL